MNILLLLLINFVTLLPLIIVYGIQEKKNRIRHIIVTFSSPDGTVKATSLKIGFSWTIFFFNEWALLFRGQFIEFIVMLFMSFILNGLALASLAGFVPGAEGSFETATTLGIVGYVIFTLSNTLVNYYYILFGNKLRLKSLYRKGFSFDNGQNEDVEDIYKYIGATPRIKPADLKPGERQGSAHKYVVPDEQVNSTDDNLDYSNLTLQDIKLLLKSEGIPFTNEDSKEDLLLVIEEEIVAPKRKKEAAAKRKITNSKYSKLTIKELVEELDKKKLNYKNTMTKPDLVKILIENDNKKA